jgi:hypothetical protein
MKGICFEEVMFENVICNLKTQTRRLSKGKPARYKVGETLFLKEPYKDYGDYVLHEYNVDIQTKLEEKWSNKLFMPCKFARYFITINNVLEERLQDITLNDCRKEGIFGLEKDESIQEYKKIINKIYGKNTWASNPPMHVYHFTLNNYLY